MKRALLVLVAVLLVSGCGDGDATGTGETTTEEDTTEVTMRAVNVYFLRDGKVWPVSRDVVESVGPLEMAGFAHAALAELTSGLSDDEESELDLTTAVPEADHESSIDAGVATVEFDGELTAEARAQIVFTLTQDPQEVTSVEIDGQSYTRADFEEQTPSVLVESPLAYDEVSSPLNARGTANTFEATFSFEIKDSEGEVIASDFATATSGSGMRGTFSFAQPFVVEGAEAGSLVVFELSAEDGSRMNEVEIPLELQG